MSTNFSTSIHFHLLNSVTVTAIIYLTVKSGITNCPPTDNKLPSRYVLSDCIPSLSHPRNKLISSLIVVNLTPSIITILSGNIVRKLPPRNILLASFLDTFVLCASVKPLPLRERCKPREIDILVSPILNRYHRHRW